MSSGDAREEKEEHTEERDLLVREEEGKQKQKMQRKEKGRKKFKVAVMKKDTDVYNGLLDSEGEGEGDRKSVV